MQLTSTNPNSTLERPVTGQIKLRGRTYPLTSEADEAVEQPNSTKQAVMTPVMRELRRSIVARIPYLTEELPRSVAELTEVYVQSIQVLEQMRKDVDELIPYLCGANLEFRCESEAVSEEARDELLANIRAGMIAKTRFPIRRPENVVTARVLALPLETAEAKYQVSIEKNVDQFVTDFFDGLDGLVDQRIAGLVEWTSQNTCEHHFFRDVLVQRETSRTRSSLGRFESDNFVTGWFERFETKSTGIHTHRWARHEHHTTNAFQTTIANTTVVMPLQIEHFVKCIPDWMAPVVRIIDGTLAREIVIEQDIETTEWQQIEAEDVPVFRCEPAVVIDQFVLTGWGPREIDAELTRRQTERLAVEKTITQRRANRSSQVCWGLVILTVCASLWLFWHSNGVSGDMTIAFVVFAAAIPFMISARTNAAVVRDQTVGQLSQIGMSCGLTLAVLSIGVLMTFGPLTLLFVLTSLVMAICGVIVVAFSSATNLDSGKELDNEYWFIQQSRSSQR